MFKKFVMAFVMNATMISVAAAASVATCVATDVTLDGTAATSCHGLYSGNVNSVEDINTVMGSDYSDMLNIDFEKGTWSVSDTVPAGFVLALKQNTMWAVYTFDFSNAIARDGFWWGTWNTSGIQWDNKPMVKGCQGCGELSHAIVAFSPLTSEVPLPGTLSLLGIGLVGLGAIRRRI